MFEKHNTINNILFFIEQAFFYLTREMKEVILSILKRELLKAMEFEGD